VGVLTAVAALLGAGTRACAVCGARLTGRHQVDRQGRPFCLAHGAAPLCPECGRLEARPTPDGTRLCPICAVGGVHQESHARAILDQVRGDLQRLGFPLPGGPMAIHLVPRGALNPQANGHGPAACEGRVAWRRWDDGTLEVLGIWIQRGLPPVSSGRIIAHELGHLWLIGARHLALPPLKAEGACELCAWLWLTARKRPQAAFKAATMERNPDPVYGAGFRAARRRYRTRGLASLEQWLKEA
jgi:hypothetical protein